MRGTKAQLTHLQDEFVKCRSWGHQWDTFHPLRRRAAWGTLLTLRCERCGTERHDTIDSLGDVSTREYKYPDGYKLSGDHAGDRLTAGDLRLEVLRRVRGGAKQPRQSRAPASKRRLRAVQ